MKHLPKIIYLSISILSACALSPQVISLNPEISVSEGNEQQFSKAINIMVNDTRDSSVLGSRGGIYSDTALLTTADNMTSNLKNILENAFSSLGYNVFGNSGSNILTVNIDELSYNADRQTAVTKVVTSASVGVSCQNPQQTMNNTYRITDTKDFITTPTARQNRDAINSTLTTAMNRMFDDETLLSCLNR